MTTRLYDLDGTLYAVSKEHQAALSRAAIATLTQHFRLTHSPEKILSLISKAMSRGKHWASPFVGQGRTLKDIHDAYHDILKLDAITGHDELPDLLAQLKGDKHYIVTHTSAACADRIVDQIKLRSTFTRNAIIGFEDYWQPKNKSALGLRIALKRAGEEPGKDTKFYEDNAPNLIPAKKELGLTTVFIGEKGKIDRKHIRYIDDVAQDICVSLRQDIQTQGAAFRFGS